MYQRPDFFFKQKYWFSQNDINPQYMYNGMIKCMIGERYIQVNNHKISSY